MRTKPSEVFGAYGTRPVDLHGDWYLVSHYARLIGMELIAICKDPSDLRLPVGSDWAETLCAKMCVSGADRRNAKAAMTKLVGAGFLHPEDGFVRITLVPLRIQSGSTSVPLRSHSGSTPDPKPSQPQEIIKPATLSSKQAKQESESSADPLQGDALVTWILSDHHRRYFAVHTRPPAGTKRKPMAEQLAEWVEGASGAYGLSNQGLASKILAGLFASKSAGEAGHLISWAVQRPEEFCGLPDGSQLQARRPRPDEAEADRKASIEAKSAAIRADYSARIKKARDEGDDYTPSILAAERDLRLSKLQAQAS